MTGHVTRSLTSLSGRFRVSAGRKSHFIFLAPGFCERRHDSIKPTVNVDTDWRLLLLSPGLRLHLAPRLAEELGSHCLPLATPGIAHSSFDTV